MPWNGASKEFTMLQVQFLESKVSLFISHFSMFAGFRPVPALLSLLSNFLECTLYSNSIAHSKALFLGSIFKDLPHFLTS